ncbi:MAG TPA: hypothetical protein VK934_04440 [Fimbriimonas sp.]|nr:hypothetical protein [Fimbriimonas sp.]
MKIGRLENYEDVPAFARDGYELHDFQNGRRSVLVRCALDPIGFLSHVLNKAQGPVSLLYVLLLSRKDENALGRYQSPYIDVAEALHFLQRFREFLMSDARHELWIHSPESLDVVYDRHERIWIYGDIDSIVGWVEGAGIPKEPLEPIPVPHSHHYHAEFDDDEDKVLGYWEWQRTPLRDADGE